MMLPFKVGRKMLWTGITRTWLHKITKFYSDFDDVEHSKSTDKWLKSHQNAILRSQYSSIMKFRIQNVSKISSEILPRFQKSKEWTENPRKELRSRENTNWLRCAQYFIERWFPSMFTGWVFGIKIHSHAFMPPNLSIWGMRASCIVSWILC